MATKAVRGKSRAKKGMPKKAAAKQAFRSKIQRKLDKRLADGLKLARELEKQNLGPDEIAARVRTHLAGVGDEIIGDVLKLASGRIFLRP